jgi:hypothetical protein
VRLLQALRGQTEQLGDGAQVPVRVADLDMTEVGRELGQVTLNIDVFLISAHQRLDGKAVAKIMQAWTMTVTRPPQADLA